MDDRDMRAYLRGACAAKFLRSWNNFMHWSRRGPIVIWRITTNDRVQHEYTVDEMHTYCEMLREAGIKPKYIGQPTD